jgi:uncharacterized protein (DUF302 family)
VRAANSRDIVPELRADISRRGVATGLRASVFLWGAGIDYEEMAMKPAGLQFRWSPHGPTETMDRLVDAVIQQGMTVFARIDHAALAAEVGLPLQPREVLIFGNPRAGTPLMQACGPLAIDLPLKAMVWQDDAGKTCLVYYDPAWLAARHGLPSEFDELLETMTKGIAEVVQRAVRA